jgi:hypothetical protein
MVRLQKPQLSAIDAWRAAQPEPCPSRPEAIRRLVEMALASAVIARKTGAKASSKARKIASKEIDRLIDQSAPPEEQQRRKQRLLKGPPEFRDVRGDLPKSKRRG